MAADCVCDLVAAACEKERGEKPSFRVRAALDALLDFLAAEPSLANLLGATAPAGVPAIAAARERLLDRLARRLHSAPAERPGDAPPSDSERRLIAAALGLIGDRAAAGEAARLPELAPELTELLAVGTSSSAGPVGRSS
ncbi:MAG TPA: hypothetical protein VFP23_01765 [Solirubrobacterales bacterium]|nr:hypothetical protein [Solirubrobacterales bacterium]